MASHRCRRRGSRHPGRTSPEQRGKHFTKEVDLRRDSLGNRGACQARRLHLRHLALGLRQSAPGRRSAGAVQSLKFDDVISACENGRHLFESLKVLQDAVDHGVFQKTLGYDPGSNTLDFHVSKVIAHRTGREPAVSVPVARVLFRYHVEHLNINSDTKFIVGQHGNNLIKVAIQHYIRDMRREPVEHQDERGRINPGVLRSIPSLEVSTTPSTDLEPQALWLLDLNAPGPNSSLETPVRLSAGLEPSGLNASLSDPR